MYTITHDPIDTHSGEPVRITYTVKDQTGAAVSIAGGAATFKVARRYDQAALLTKTQGAGVTLSSNIATVDFNTGELLDGAAPLLGDFVTQLRITKGSDSLVVAEGYLSVAPVIS